MAKNLVEFTGENFQTEVIESDKPVLVDFWAEWCGPCKMIEPVVDQIAGEMADKLSVGKLDIEAYQDITMTYGISRIPALFLFKNGEIVEKIFGTQPKGKLVATIEKHL